MTRGPVTPSDPDQDPAAEAAYLLGGRGAAWRAVVELGRRVRCPGCSGTGRRPLDRSPGGGYPCPVCAPAGRLTGGGGSGVLVPTFCSYWLEILNPLDRLGEGSPA